MVIREYEGRTEREAVKRAVEDLGVSGDKLKIEVITEKSKFFSFGSTVKIRVYLDDIEDTVSNKVGKFLQGMFQTIGVDISIQTIEETDKLYVEIISDSAGIIIGKRGKTLEALQLITNIIVNKDKEKWIKVILDIENYRDKRENTLTDLAVKVAGKVKKTGKFQILEPMNPFERRIIHMALQNDSRIFTKSEGAGNLKKVKIYLRRRKD
ncbi:MAG: KH domain-containing protein [Spirochaetes bacterium]|nr:KH domain-containing protein [Spirochaetota bacterium]